MKLSRDDLKGIVKECLVEILSEGISKTAHQINEVKSHKLVGSSSSSKSPPIQRSNVADKISFLPKQQVQEAQRFDKKALTAITADPILQAMLEDTAIRGTPISDNSPGKADLHETAVAIQGDQAAKKMLRSDPSDIFGETSSKWAMLAFSDKKTSN
jgi:hypothetical protein